MSRKTVFVVLHTLLLLGLSTFVFSIFPVQAGTSVIVITPDGNVSPEGAGLNKTSPNVYTLVDNILNTTILVQRSNITLDGDGYALHGPGWSETGMLKVYGISITPPSYAMDAAGNITIKNIRVENYNYGIFFNRTRLNVLTESSLANNQYGFWATDSYNNVFFGNTFSYNDRGMWFYLGAHNNVSRNTFVENTDRGVAFTESLNNSVFWNNITNVNRRGGIFFQYFSKFNTIFGNNLTDAEVEFIQSSYNNFTRNNLIRGWFLDWDSHKLTVEDNFENGKPIVYLEGVSDYVFTGEAGQVTIVDSNRVRVENLSISDTGYGIVLWGSNNTVIARNNITSTNSGIYINSIHGAYNNTVIDNRVSSSAFRGISAGVAHGAVIANNTVTNSRYGIAVVGWVMFDGKTPLKTTVIENNVTKNQHGISVNTINCDIIGNNVKSNNSTGISIGDSAKIRVYHNNLINNTVQAIVQSPRDVHVWDNGYPSGGNYWSNYAGMDADYDGIGDAYYYINTTYPQGTQVDRYPLMAPLNVFNAGTWNNKTYEVEVVSNSNVTNFNFNPDNRTLNFDVEGAQGTLGFSRVAIPTGLMWCDNLDQWAITVGGILTTPLTKTEQGNYTYIYFVYGHSAKKVEIESTHAVPEFQGLIIAAILIILTMLVAMIRKKQTRNKPQEK